MASDPSFSDDFATHMQKNIRTLAESIKLSGTLPVGSARNNFNVCFPKFNEEVKPYSDQTLSMLSMLLSREGMKMNIAHCDNEEKVDLVVDGVNKILDRVRDNLNVLNGIKSNPLSAESASNKEKNISGSWNQDLKKSVVWKANQPEKLFKPIHVRKVLEKPQSKFEQKVDNSKTPFRPQLENKPHAIKPLAIYIERSLNGIERYCHPYMHELNGFEVPQCQLDKVEPILPDELDSSCPVYVDCEAALANMMKNLRNEKELAVDLEYHHYRSFQGFTCLLQISTRKVDYIIDTLALRSKLHVLNEFFVDPKVVKVLHGASSDVVWLQKDLNLYLVNMFDTHLAALTLDFPRLSLAFLLKHYCNVDADKRYQLFDWRIRPLPEAALVYARNDTHYLLYIYDQLKNALIEKANGLTNLLQSVYTRSTDLCKMRYEKTFDDHGYHKLYKESKQTFDNRQMHALKLLYEWRDQIAREKDESTGFVLPNHMLLQIAEILPREMQGVLACCNPIPTIVRQNLSHLHKLITEARHQPINKMVSREDRESMTINQTPALSKLRCPHDFSYHDDFRDNLSTLLNGTDVINVPEKENPLRLSVFDGIPNASVAESIDEAKTRISMLRCVTFVSPYERYKRTVKFVVAVNEKDDREKQKEAAEKKDDGTLKKVELEENIYLCELTSSDGRVNARLPALSSISANDVEADSESANDMDKLTSVNANVYPEPCTRVVKRKQKTLSDQVASKRAAKCYEVVMESVRVETPALKPEENDIPDLEAEIENPRQRLVNERKQDGRQTSKKKNKTSQEGEKSGGDAKEKTRHTPFDYAKANYDKFMTTGPKNLKKLLSSKISFGANKKKRTQTFQKQKGNR